MVDYNSINHFEVGNGFAFLTSDPLLCCSHKQTSHVDSHFSVMVMRLYKTDESQDMQFNG